MFGSAPALSVGLLRFLEDGMGPGVYSLSDEEYNDLDMARWSEVKLMLDCPAEYKHRKDHGTKPTASMSLGSMVHSMVLEPAMVNSRYVRHEKLDRRTKAGKERWKELQEEADGRELVEASVFDQAMGLADKLGRAMSSELHGWRDARKELAVVGEILSIPAKCKIDLVIDGQVWDVKTTKDLSPRNFMTSCFRLGYYGQIATYQELLDQHEDGTEMGGIIAVQTVGAPVVHVLRFSDEAKRLGRKMRFEAWTRLRMCRDEQVWPGYRFGEELGVPGWAWTEF